MFCVHSLIRVCFTARAVRVCVLPAANSAQTTTSRSRAATREAMSPFLRRSELRSAASESLQECGGVAVRVGCCRCIYAPIKESESVICAHWLEMVKKLAPDSHVPSQLPLHSSTPLFFHAWIFLCVFPDSLRRIFTGAFILHDKYLLSFIQSIHALQWDSQFIFKSANAVKR